MLSMLLRHFSQLKLLKVGKKSVKSNLLSGEASSTELKQRGLVEAWGHFWYNKKQCAAGQPRTSAYYGEDWSRSIMAFDPQGQAGAPGDEDLYEVLGLFPTATDEDIDAAYHRLLNGLITTVA